MTNDSKANLNQQSLYRNNNDQTLIEHKRSNNLDKAIINMWICSNSTKQPLNQSDHRPKVNQNQLPLYGNKTSSRVAFKPSLILGARFLMYSASKNSNWDQLQQVSRTKKLEITTLIKCCLLSITVVEASMSGNLCKSIICAKCSHFDRCWYIGWFSREACSFNLVTNCDQFS